MAVDDDPILQRLQAALVDHEAGRLDAAEAAYRALLADAPDHPDALHLLGLVMDQRDRLDEARHLIGRAIAVAPHTGDFHFNLGNVLRRRGEFEQAKVAWRRAAVLAPTLMADAYTCVAALCAEQGRAATEVALWQRASALAATDPTAAELADVLADAGDAASAVEFAARAVRQNPADGWAHNRLGRVLLMLGGASEAADAFRAAATLLPREPRVLANLASAIECTGAKDLGEAVAAARRAIELDPAFAGAQELLAGLLRDAGRPGESAAVARRAIELASSSPRAYETLGNALFDLGDARGAVDAFSRAVELDPARSATHSNLLMAMHYDDARFSAQKIYDETRRWADRYADPFTDRAERHRPPHPNPRDPGRRLRVGYLSPDFRRHPVSLFFAPLLFNHDPAAVEVFLYSNTQRPDDVTDRFRGHAGVQFRDVTRLTDDEADELVRADGIDVLVDLAGHTANHRLLLMARRPAPVQATYIGYWNTTGMRAVDYYLTDLRNDPPGMTDRWWVERPAMIEGGAWCFRPPTSRPEVNASPAETGGGVVTFVSMNKSVKISSATLDAWRQILLRSRRARLLLVGLGDDRRVRDAFRGIDRGRYEIVNRVPFEEYLKLYHRADVLLDVWPHNGHTTSVDALWAGLPVLTCAGDLHCSRLGASLLAAVGLEEFAASSPQEYVDRAVAMEDRVDHLAALRSGMRDRIRSSPLTDGPRLARSVETAYRAMWKAWCDGVQPR